jgi:hypothetical protein
MKLNMAIFAQPNWITLPSYLYFLAAFKTFSIYKLSRNLGIFLKYQGDIVSAEAKRVGCCHINFHGTCLVRNIV